MAPPPACPPAPRRPCPTPTAGALVAALILLPPSAGRAQAIAQTLPAAAAPDTTSADRPAEPRATLTADVLAASAFVWRGVTNTNRPVLGPTLTLAAPVQAGRLRGATVTAGAWGNVEPAAYTGARDLSTYAGARGPALTMSQLWVEARRPLPADAALTLGATAYLYPRVGDLAHTYETGELYALAAAGGPLAPSLGVWVDAWKVRGTYAEAAVSHAATLPAALPRWAGAGHAVTLGAAVGYSAGMGARDGQAAYFAADGVTHAEVWASTEVGLGAVTLLPTAHLVFGRDAAARLVAPDAARAAKLWAGASLRWTGAVRAARHPGRATAAASDAAPRAVPPRAVASSAPASSAAATAAAVPPR